MQGIYQRTKALNAELHSQVKRVQLISVTVSARWFEVQTQQHILWLCRNLRVCRRRPPAMNPITGYTANEGR